MDDIKTCTWCNEEYEEGELKQTNYGLLCHTCILAIKSRGEEIIITE